MTSEVRLRRGRSLDSLQVPSIELSTGDYHYGMNARGESDTRYRTTVQSESEVKPQGRFQDRDISMMAFGAVVGYGLLFKSGDVLFFAGPVSLLLAYILIGTVLYAISLGEMISHTPLPGGQFALANRVLSPALGFAGGWMYWLLYGLSNALLATASSYVFQHLTSTVNRQLWIAIFLAITLMLNAFNVSLFGKIEFWITSIKMLFVLALIVLGLILPLDAVSSGRALGTVNATVSVQCESCPSPGFDYWREAAFKEFIVPQTSGYLAGFWECCSLAAFSYIGCEALGTIAVNAERHRETLPFAIKRVTYRVVFFAVAAIFVLGLNVSANDPLLKLSLYNRTKFAGSPFILMINRAGIGGADSVFSAFLLVAALSSANAHLYVATRTLYGLSLEGNAPRLFSKRLGIQKVPIYALLLSFQLTLLAFVGSPTSNAFFDVLYQIITTTGLLSWAISCAVYIRFRRAVQVQRLEYAIVRASRSSLQPFLAIYGLSASVLLVLFQGYKFFARNSSFWVLFPFSWGYTSTTWITIGVFFLLIVGWLIVEGGWTWHVPSLLMIDLVSGAAPRIVRDEKSLPLWRRAIVQILNYL